MAEITTFYSKMECSNPPCLIVEGGGFCPPHFLSLIIGNYRNKKMNKILLVHKGNLQAKKFILEELIDLGCYLVLLSCFEEDCTLSLVDKVLVADYGNFEEVMDKVAREAEEGPFDGIFGYDELTIPLVDEISKYLGLKPISYYCAESYRYKDRMRMVWESNKIPCPRYQTLSGISDRRKLKNFNYPIVIKPTGLLSSIGVIKVHSNEETEAKIKQLMNVDYEFTNGQKLYSMKTLFGLKADLIAEEYIEGNEYSAEGYTVDGTYHLIGITKKYTTTNDYFDETAHIFPALPFDNQEEVNRTLSKAHEALGIADAFTHTEFKVHDEKCYLIEMGARLAGDFIPRLIEISTGLSVVETALNVRIGRAIQYQEVEKKTYAAVCFIHAPSEAFGKAFKGYCLKEVEGINVIEHVAYLEDGEIIDTPDCYGVERVGHVIFECDSYYEAERYIQSIEENAQVYYA